MSRYMDQGNKDMDVGVKAPMSGRGGAAVLKEADGRTVGIVTSQKGIGKDGLPVKGGK